MRRGIIGKSKECPLPNIVTENLQLFLDSGIDCSYNGSGNIWTDLSNNSQNLDLYNTTFSNDEMIFNGSDSYATNSNFTPTLNNSAFTVSVWLKPSTSFTNRVYFMFGNGSGANNNQLHFRIMSGTSIRYSLYAQDWNLYNISNLFDGTWHNLVGTFSSSWLKGFYQNNVSKGTYQRSSPLASTESNLRVGSFWGWQHFPGSIAVVLVYNKQLNASELTQNYDALKSRFGR